MARRAWSTVHLPPTTLLLFLVSSSSSANRTGLLVNKCCPAGQQLSKLLDGCVTYDAVEDPESLAHRGLETVEELRSRYDHFPWWMDPAASLYTSDNASERAGSFLADQPGDLIIQYGVFPLCDFQETQHVPSRKHSYKMLLNGSLSLDVSNSEEPVLLDPEDYCVDRVDMDAHGKQIVTFLVCPCLKVLCINKCCGGRKLLNVTSFRKSVGSECRTFPHSPWTPTFYPDSNETNVTVEVPHYLLKGRGLQCGEGFVSVLLNTEPPSEEESKAFWIAPNGSVLIENWGRGRMYSRDQYCADWSFFPQDGRTVENVRFCHPVRPPEPLEPTDLFYVVMFVVSATFLLLTLLVYAALPDLRRPSHAKALMCHAAALLAASVLSAHFRLHSTLDRAECFAAAFLIQFFLLAAFFWLTVMCLDISWTFSGFRAKSGRAGRKFVWYSFFAWGGPALVSGATVFMEFTEGLPRGLLRPNIGVTNCWFYPMWSTVAYFYGPLGALLALNAVLFLATSVRIARVHRETALLERGDSTRHDANGGTNSKRRILLYFKLFGLMGVTWVTEIVTWAWTGGGPYFTFTADFINLLRGLFIFVIFCCKRKVWWLLRRRLGQWGLPGGLTGPDALRHPRLRDPRKSSSTTLHSSLSLTIFNPTAMAAAAAAVASEQKNGGQDGAATATAGDGGSGEPPATPTVVAAPSLPTISEDIHC